MTDKQYLFDCEIPTVDIKGRSKEQLKGRERLEWIDSETLNFIRDQNRTGIYCQIVPDREHPQRFPKNAVVRTRSNSHIGLFSAVVRMSQKGAPMVAMDVLGKGRVLVEPENVVVLPFAQADEFMPSDIRNSGMRLIRSLRDAGAQPVKEPEFLARLLTTFNMDKEFLRLYEEKSQFGLSFALDFATQTTLRKRKKLRVNDYDRAVGRTSGRLVYDMLCDFGLRPANCYHGLHELLRVYAAQRKAVIELNEQLDIEFFALAAEDDDGYVK